MKKFKFLLFALAAVAFASCGNSDKKQSAEVAVQSDSLQRVITQKDNEINDMMETFNQIQEGLREIDEAQNRVSIVKNGEGANKRRQIIENIQFISNTMKQNRALIEKLRQQMRESSVKGDQLRKTIEDLVKQMRYLLAQLLDGGTVLRASRQNRRRRARLSTLRTSSSTPHGLYSEPRRS